MNISKKFLATCAASALAALAVGVQQTSKAAPQLTIQSEEAAHPRLVRAIHELEDAIHELQAAPDDFGGNKGVAINDCVKAKHSLRKALYYRLHMDDAAIDRVQ